MLPLFYGGKMIPCFVIVGLGNPGERYALNRHNIGFLAVDAVCQFFKAPPYAEKYHGHFSQIILKKEDLSPYCSKNNIDVTQGVHIFFLKPLTFMNLSGKSVQSLIQFYKIPVSNVIVIHDELDVETGKIKIKIGGGAGGHNGLKSIDQCIGQNYMRVRLGIGHPGHRDLVTPYVLGNFTRNDQNWLEPMLWTIGNMLPFLCVEESSKWLTLYHKKIKEMETR